MIESHTQLATHVFSPWRVTADGRRIRTAASTWRKVERWNRQAYDLECYYAANRNDDPQRPRVLTSQCDPFRYWCGPILDAKGEVICVMLPPGTGTHRNDPIDLDYVRSEYFSLIDLCPNMDFLLETKHPENVGRMWTSRFRENDQRSNVWLLFSVGDQNMLDTGVSDLLACRKFAPMPILGLSLELTESVNLTVLPHERYGNVMLQDGWLDWVIVGGQRGPNAMPCNVEWIRSVVEQCHQAGVPCFVQQLGSGADPSRWPEDLRVWKFPKRGEKA